MMIMMKKIEVLFPEVCNLYGDLFNIKYLAKNVKDVQIINTALTDEPEFVKNDVDMIYMAPMTEKTQEIVIQKLLPYKDRILELINKNKIFLFTGNALEILGQYIENEDGTKISGLKITNIYAKRQMMNRFNSLFLGTFDNIRIVGFKAQFSMSYGNNENSFLFKSVRGCGINKESELEGIKINNCFGTYVLGPILILNPLFTKYILKLLGQNEDLIFEEEINNAYNIRLKEFEDEKTKFE